MGSQLPVLGLRRVPFLHLGFLVPVLTGDFFWVFGLEDFLLSLEKNKDHFNSILKKAQENDSRLKFVAKLDKGKASVGLESVSTEHPFYNLVGSDNITVFFTERYKDSPLVVKGAGAGGEFTASGVFADIIKASQGNG